jgi:hypothetical protein
MYIYIASEGAQHAELLTAGFLWAQYIRVCSRIWGGGCTQHKRDSDIRQDCTVLPRGLNKFLFQITVMRDPKY